MEQDLLEVVQEQGEPEDFATDMTDQDLHLEPEGFLAEVAVFVGIPNYTKRAKKMRKQGLKNKPKT